jgi:hypothetical protein
LRGQAVDGEGDVDAGVHFEHVGFGRDVAGGSLANADPSSAQGPFQAASNESVT